MNKILASLITLFVFSELQAQPTTAPRLIVGLTIDQLRTDYLEAFSSLYGEKGFKKLWKEAMVVRNIQYGFSTRDRSSAISSIYTGTTPSVHGIIANRWLDATTLHPVNCVDDASFMGNFTTESTSPAKLLSSTITDELEIFTQGKSLVYSISPFRESAVLSAGHAANGAYWINYDTGKWCSSTYYKDFPAWLSNYNSSKAPDSKISNLTWIPCNDIKRYKFLPSGNTKGFKHHFADNKQDKYRLLITSPLINDEVNLLTEQTFQNTSIGRDSIPDMLCLSYYAGNYNHRVANSLELQDAYVRLDRSVASLLEMLDRYVGLQHVLFFITSTGYHDSNEPDPSSYRIPSGEFNMKHCAALLNMYLMAIYGNGQYINGYYDNQIYLNHRLIEQKKLDLNVIQDKSSEFLMQFSGVNEAYSAHELLNGAWSSRIDEIRNGYNRLHSGDLLVSVLPGWTIIDEQHNLEKIVRNGYIPAPLILLGGGFKASTINTPVNVGCIAPTITSCLHIRAPNSSTYAPLTHIH